MTVASPSPPSRTVIAMNGFGPNSNDRAPRRRSSAPWGVDPDGRLVYEFAQLPEMPVLERVVIGSHHIEINGWIFPYNRMTKGFLKWFHATLVVWVKSHPGTGHRQWIEGLVETFQERFSGVF